MLPEMPNAPASLATPSSACLTMMVTFLMSSISHALRVLTNAAADEQCVLIASYVPLRVTTSISSVG